MAEFDDIKLFGSKSLSDVMKEIHSSHKKTSEKIDSIIEKLNGMVLTIADAIAISPYLNSYFDSSIKNDDVKAKFFAVIVKSVQRAKDENTDVFLTEEEKKYLLQVSQPHLIEEEVKILESK